MTWKQGMTFCFQLLQNTYYRAEALLLPIWRLGCRSQLSKRYNLQVLSSASTAADSQYYRQQPEEIPRKKKRIKLETELGKVDPEGFYKHLYVILSNLNTLAITPSELIKRLRNVSTRRYCAFVRRLLVSTLNMSSPYITKPLEVSRYYSSSGRNFQFCSTVQTHPTTTLDNSTLRLKIRT